MRTKTLLLTAALSLAGIASSMAQVYSVNAVGYVNVTLQRGFNLIANQLVQTNYALSSLIPASALPEGTQVYTYSGATGFSLYEVIGGQYDPDPGAAQVAFGVGVFINNQSASAFPITFVGEVAQGALSNPVPAGFSIRASQVPQSGALQTVLSYPAANGDIVYLYANDGPGGAPDGYQQYEVIGTDWDPGEPSVAVGQAIFVSAGAAHPAWTRTFTVN